MENLKNNLSKIRQTIQNQETKDKKLRQDFKKAIGEIFPELKNPLQYVKDFYFKSGRLYIIAANKSFANEIQLNKNKLAGKVKIESIVVK